MTLATDLHAALSTTGYPVYPARFPQGAAFPNVVYQTISRVPEHAMNRAIGAYHERVQVSVRATDHDTALEAADTVRDALLGYFGDSVTVYALGIDHEAMLDEPETGLYHVPIDAVIVWSP